MGQKPSQPNQKRRAVLRGSLAAPVVLTVSPAVSAARTSFETKVEGLKTYQPARSQYFKESPDNWLRRSVQVVKLKYKEKGNGPDSKSAKEDWYYLDPNKSRYIKLSSMEWMSFGAILPEGWEQTRETGTRYLLVWLDPKTGEQSLMAQAEPKGGQLAATESIGILSFTGTVGAG